MLCTICGETNRADARFCSSCGAAAQVLCAACGRGLVGDARFCDGCGAQIAPAASAAPPDEMPSTGPETGAAQTPEQTAETAEFLGRLSIFQYLGQEALERLAGQLSLVSLPEGPIFKEKDPVHGLYIIKSGAAKVTRSAQGGGPEAVLAILSQGDSFGEVGLIDGMPRSADVSAMQATDCYLLERDTFFNLLERHPEMARHMLQALASMVRNADEWIAQTI